MIAAPLMLSMALFGVDTGWQTLPDGQAEFIIQIEPDLLEALKEGQEITSEIPADLQRVRRYRIMIGDQPLPREQGVIKAAKPATNGQDSPGPLFPETRQEVVAKKPESPPELPAESETPEPAAAPDENKPLHDFNELLVSVGEVDISKGVGLLLGLAASLGGNLFLALVIWSQRRRNTQIAKQLQYAKTLPGWL